MKKKFSKILGVMLPVAMILAMTVSLVPARTLPTVEAAALRFSSVAIPTIGAGGKYLLNPNRDAGVIAAGGAVMFASTGNTSVNMTNLLKSTDDGKTWSLQTGFKTATTANVDNTTNIVAIGLSPSYTSDTTVLVATDKNVYQSVDGGSAFSVMTGIWTAGETITSMDIALDSRGRVSVIVGTTGAGNIGEVYVYAPATTGMGWKAQAVGATHNVLAVAFSPYFGSDEGIFAVTVNTTVGSITQIRNSFGSTKLGGGWAANFGDGRFRDRLAVDIVATRASIAFPNDFNIDSLTSNVAFVGLYAGTSDGQNAETGNEKGDAYKVIFQPNLSSTIDLNVRGLVSTIQTSTNIYSIDVSGTAAAANIVVGTDFWSTGVTNYYWLLYYSTDSGVTWASPRESQPTGGDPGATSTATVNNESTAGTARTNVLIPGDFAKTKTAYAATSGYKTAGFSRTDDSGKSWRQISLVDWASTNYTVSELDLVSTSKWYMRFTYTDNITYRGLADAPLSSYWVTSNGGANYERLYSYANPTMPVSLDGLDITGAVNFFINDKNKFWRSTDSGATFPRIITPKAAFTGSSIIDENSIWTILADGKIWQTANLGRLWVEPTESIITATGSSASRSTSGNLSLVPIANGTVFVSTDNGTTYKSTLGLTNLGAGSINIDSGYATNKFVYHSQTAVNGGVWRIVVNEADPDSTAWERIDAAAPTNLTVAGLVRPAGAITNTGGIMYMASNATVNTTGEIAGGIWRSTNPAALITSIYPPHFVNINAGLPDGAVMSRLGVLTTPEPTLYYRNTLANTAATYTTQIYVFSDTLATAAAQVAPADKAINAGVSLSVDALTMTAVLSWGAKAGATSYQYQIARDTAFSSIVAQGYSTGQEVSIPGHITGTTYYWRVRVAQTPDPADLSLGPRGAPLISPWSTARSFSVGSAVSAAFKSTSPAVGAIDVALQPTFVWTPFVGAINYEVMVSEGKDFAIIEWSHTTTDTFYKAVEETPLAYGKTYYWRVRGTTGPVPATGPAPGGPWATGVFTTEAKPVPVEPAVITVVEPAKPAEIKVVEVPVPGPAQPIPSYLLWAIIGIGAILVIALIVLIVRTRRVA